MTNYVGMVWVGLNVDPTMSSDEPDVLIVEETGEPVVLWMGGNWLEEESDPDSQEFLYRMRDGHYKRQNQMVNGDIRRLVDIETIWENNAWSCVTLTKEEKMVLTLRGVVYE